MDMQLVVFVEVVKRKNFTRAAEALHMTQPAVSQYIASLEREFGVRLLERSNKAVQLNKAGAIVYKYAQEILRNYKQMTILVSDLKNNPSGSLEIGASYTIGEYILSQILVKLQTAYPLIAPNVTIGNTAEIARKLVDHEIDIALIEGNFSNKDIQTECFAVDEMYIIASPRTSLINKTITVADLEKETWIIREEGSGTGTITQDFLHKHNIVPKRVLTFGSTQIIKEAVESGLGISMLSKWTLQRELSLGTIVKLTVEGTPVERDFSIIKGKQAFYPKIIQVFEEVVKHTK